MYKILVALLPIIAGQVEFSTRPNNVSILLLYFTHDATQKATVLAPFGVWSLLAGVSFGASGDTRREIFRSCLLLTDMKKFYDQYITLVDSVFNNHTDEVNASSTNFYFIDRFFNEVSNRDYHDDLVQNSRVIITYLDFETPSHAAARANKRVSLQSPPVSNVYVPEDFTGASMLMGNVIFFKGLWTLPFNVSYTRIERVDGSLVEMMFQRAKVPYSHLDSMKASVMELSYGSDGKYCMLLIYPDSNLNVKNVYKYFEKITFKDILNTLQEDVSKNGLKEIDIKLPRFKKSTYVYLNKPLNDMGIYNAFDPTYARFPYIAREPIYIETIEHNTVLTVTESGIVAFSATPGRGKAFDQLQDENIPTNLILFVLERTTATVILGGIFP